MCEGLNREIRTNRRFLEKYMSIRIAAICGILALSPVSVFADVQDFRSVDAQVSKLAKQSSITTLVTALSAVAHTDWERARAGYDWVAMNVAYDAYAYFHGTPTAIDAQDVFKTGKSVCQGYADLYATIVRAMGLECEVVIGYGKGMSYLSDLKLAAPNHAWNAVKLDGSWHLLDATWGAGGLDASAQFRRSFDGFWFDTAADAFAVHHLPQDPQWRLFESSITLAEFVLAPPIEVKMLEKLVGSGMQVGDILGLAKSYTFNDGDSFSIKSLVSMGGTIGNAVAMMKDGGMPEFDDGGDWYHVHLFEFPVTGVFKVGDTYHFAMDIKIKDFPYFTGKVAFTSSKVFKLLKRNGDTFSGEITIKESDIADPINIIMLTRTKDNEAGYQIIARWNVKK